MKKVYLLGFILAATVAHISSASAESGAVAVTPAPAGCPKAFQGFHLGGNIGYGVGWAKTSFSNDANNTSWSHTRGLRGVDGGIGVGYTQRLCNWALGIVFDANWTGVKGKHSFTETDGNGNTLISANHTARLKNSLQLYARLGYVMREIAMPFVALGWDNSQWKQSASFTDNNPPASTESASRSKRINSLLWKVGVDFLATRHVVVGFDYTGTYGGKLSAGGDKDDEGNRNLHASFKPQYNKFALTAKIVY